MISREETDTTVFLQSPGGVFHGLLCQPALLEINARITIDLTIYPRRQDPFAGGNLIWESVDLTDQPFSNTTSMDFPLFQCRPRIKEADFMKSMEGLNRFLRVFAPWFQRGIHHLQRGSAYPLIQLVHGDGLSCPMLGGHH